MNVPRHALDRTCEAYGCAKVGLDPKLHVFDECFAHGIRFGDIDGSVERNGFILWMEWKISINEASFERDHRAQVIQAKAFTLNCPRQMFVFVVGDPRSMVVEKFRYMRSGLWAGEWIAGDKFCAFLRWWFDSAERRAIA